MDKGKIVIIDDDIEFANRLKKHVLKYYDEEITIIDFFDWEFINANKIDLLFLDIELGKEENKEDEVNGIEEAIKIRNLKRWDIEIIFITSHGNFITSSFDAGPVYFIDKSELDERLPRAIEALKRKGFRKERVVQIGDQSVNIDDIIYISSAKHYVYFRSRYPSSDIKIRMTLDQVEELGIDTLARIHKSYVVNMVFIKKKYIDKVILFDDRQLRVSRKYQEYFKKRYVNAKMKEII
jgi:DNA-binding LytR/AlgR family response regulator